MVEYLSGGRVQGSSSAESSTVTTEQDLFNSSFTTSGNASQTTATDTTGKVVMTQSGGSGNNAKAYRTLSNSYNAKTFTIDFTFTRNSGDNANNSGVSFGSDNTADGNISGNAKRLMFAFENGSYIRVKVETVATNNTFTDSTSFQATGTTKYYRFVGNGSNVVLTMFPTLSDRTNGTNADRTYQSVDFPSDWLTTDSIDTFTLEGWSGYHAGNWEVSDVQISMNNYADEKDSLTNVPANTRYEETDTRKIYRRTAEGTFTSTDYTTSNFTAVGSTVAITSNSAVSTSTPSNTANRVYATIPSLKSTDAWSCDFQLYVTADATNDYHTIAFCTNSDAFNTSGQNHISLQTQGGSYNRFVLNARIGGSNSETATSSSTRSLSTNYYCTLSSDGADTARIRIWTNSNRTGTPDQDKTLSIANIGTLTTVMHGTRNSGDTNVWSGTTSNVSLTNPAKWIERNTA